MTAETGAAAPNANIALLFEQAAARRSEAAALIAHDARVLWRFGDLAEASARMAGGLVDLGLGRGDRVVVLEQDRRELFRAVVAVIWAGGSVVLPPASMPIRLALEVASALRPSAVLTSLPLWPVAALYPGLRRAPIRVVNAPFSVPGAGSTREIGRHQPIALRPVVAEHLALTSFTTGTTGPSKVVARSHGVLRAQHHALQALRSLTDTDRDFAGLPMLVLDNLASGVTSILPPRGPGSPSYGPRIREAIARAKATSAAGFPHQLQSAVLGAHPGELAGLRTIQVGGDRVRPELLEALAAAAPGVACSVVYGSTEIEPISAIDAATYRQLIATSDPADGTCVGRIVDGLELRFEPLSNDPGVARARALRGRILLRGAHASGPNGAGDWVDTGDVGWVDPDSRLWLLGRAANVVASLYPVAVERVIETMLWVDQAAFVRGTSGRSLGVLAVQPRRWGSRVVQAEQFNELAKAASERGWPLDAILLLRRLPRSRGPGSKVDAGRLASLASTQRRRGAPEPSSAWR